MKNNVDPDPVDALYDAIEEYHRARTRYEEFDAERSNGMLTKSVERRLKEQHAGNLGEARTKLRAAMGALIEDIGLNGNCCHYEGGCQ